MKRYTRYGRAFEGGHSFGWEHGGEMPEGDYVLASDAESRIVYLEKLLSEAAEALYGAVSVATGGDFTDLAQRIDQETGEAK